jgi:hypothetical protein
MSFSILNKSNNTLRYGRGQQRPKLKDSKGNWEASLTQRGKADSQIKEQALKAQCSTGSLDHSKLDSMRRVIKSTYQMLKEKEENKISMTKPERMNLAIYREREQVLIDNDMLKIKKHGLNAQVETDYGRIHRLLMTASFILSGTKVDKYDDIYYIYRKLLIFDKKKLGNLQFIPEDIRKNQEYRDVFKEFITISIKVDTIEKQFNKYHGSMPPLDERNFVALDEWQKKYLDNIDGNISTVVQASTSAGKSILTGYGFLKKRKAIVVVPTDPLVWQTASMIGKITGDDVPIITRTYQTETSRDELIKRIERTGIVVGTAQFLNDYLPLINVEWDYIILDEIHMIGNVHSSEMELICKVYNNVQIILLSATIGNVDEFKEWLTRIGHSNVDIIKCDKRFFNLQRFYYDSIENKLIRIHPLSSVAVRDIESGSVLKKTHNATPPDIWVLAMNLMKTCKLGSLDPYLHFLKTQVITLDEANSYFRLLLEWMVTNYASNKDAIIEILKLYNHDELLVEQPSLYDLGMLLKEQDKTPALFFQTDSHRCLELIREFSRTIREQEDAAHPDLLKKRLKEQSRARANDKKIEQLKVDGMREKQIQKLMMSGTFDEPSSDNISLNEPHPDFIFNKHQYFSQHMVDEWNTELKKFFPAYGSEYHYIIDLLWRGVGVYVKGLPDPYLHIVQNLACAGKLGIVFSDESLVFGVSMPFRTSVITPDENIDSMMYHQMAGRAGRRGLDKEGNVIFAGFSGKQIQTLSTSSIPYIKGCDTMFYGLGYAAKLSTDPRWNNIKSNFLLSEITNEDAESFYSGIEDNLSPTGGWSFANSDNKNFLHMVWRLRHSEDCFRIPFLISFMKKIFCNANPSNETTQIDFCKFLLQFIDTIEAKDNINVLSPVKCSSQYAIHRHFEQLGLEVPKKVDSKVFESIQRNSIIVTESMKEKSLIRERLFKFGEKIRIIQHYFFFSEEVVLARLLSKILTRIWWIYHMSSPVMESVAAYISTDYIKDTTNSNTTTEESDEDDKDDEEDEEEDDDE